MNELEWWQLLLVPVFLFVPLLRIHATYVLWKVWKAGGGGVALERMVVALSGTVGSALIAGLVILRIAGAGSLYPISVFVTLLALLAFAIPAVTWEYMYRTGKLEH